jgi:hypothetical protein
MKKLAILMFLALELAVCGCGTTPPSTITNTQTLGNWEAHLIGGTGAASQLNFVTSFNVTNNGPLGDIIVGFYNDGACFSTGENVTSESGTASFTTNTSTDQVTGALTLTVNSITPPGNVLTLTSYANGLTGTSNGTSSTTGTLSNGLVVGYWGLSGSASCTGGPASIGGPGTPFTFSMCQTLTSTGVCPTPP